MAWLDIILMYLVRPIRKAALMRARKIDPNFSVAEQALGIYVAALKRLMLYVVLFVIVWVAALMLGKLLPIEAATILLVSSTLLLGAAAWPIAFVFFEHEHYQKTAASIVATELGIGLVGMFIHIPLNDVIVMQIAGLYLVFSSYLGKTKGIRRLGNWFATAVMAFMVLSAVAPAFAGALRAVPSALDNAAARATTSAISAISADSSNHQYLLSLPAGGGWSKKFDPNSVVPAGWFYMIKPLPGTQAKWQNGSVSSYWNLPQHPWQPFQLSNKDGGEAIIVWKPTPYYTSTGQ